MDMKRCTRIAIEILLGAIFPISTEAFSKSQFLPSNTITKDVLILGGGASGAHAAVRLREDLGKSVAVIEKQDHLVSL